MKLALVTTAPEIHSGIGDYTRHLLPYLAQRCQVEVYVRDGTEGTQLDGFTTRALSTLGAGAADRILYQLGNEANHAFMVPAIQRLGGVVMQHDWVLFDLAMACHPALVRGGVKGATLAGRLGGRTQLATYVRAFGARRQERRRPLQPVEPNGRPGNLVGGWHAPEGTGRWVADNGVFRIPAEGVRSVAVTFNAPVGRRVELRQGGQVLARYRTTPEQPWERLEIEPAERERPTLVLHVDPVRVTKEQRLHGDARRLGAFIERIEWSDADGRHDLDLRAPAAVPLRPSSLSDFRFDLPLNRGVVRHADGFVVHSEFVAEHIRATRPNVGVGVVHHGAERRWHEQTRAAARLELGLPRSWADGFLVTSLGGVQAHKRVDRVLAALAQARRERPDIRLAMAGRVCSESFDAREVAESMGLGDAVHFPGFVSEEDAWRWLHAGDVSINLRGPTSGGTSGGIFQAFGLGRAVIASNAAEQRELPDACTIKVPLGEGEVDAVARAMVELRDDAARVERLSAAARAFVDDECHWSHCADRYVTYLERAPRPRGV
ncbi:glycosyltransferase family 4 protein [Engelhardtia mirabilis]|uniref:Glycosyl transferases group 1 n=1 Tax=Engelhardtia mirabilis TaxID=2528011 RepID=A0A518BFK4_9BACT|nr:Glycosyl transferases group 1 [Planctomycetes bacterium Pla133]QDV00093.1 Glycosyl transferases group 1 [Planctomycetes bacterium Pla86]